MTKQEIYEKIVRLTAELTAINLAQRIFEAAKTGEPEEVETVFETFKKEHTELYQEIVDFGEEYKEITVHNGEVFDERRSHADGYWVFNTTKINATNFYIFTLIAGFDDSDLFRWNYVCSSKYIEAIEKDGYEQLAKFVSSELWTEWVGENEKYLDIYRLLVGIFEGDFQ